MPLLFGLLIKKDRAHDKSCIRGAKDREIKQARKKNNGRGGGERNVLISFKQKGKKISHYMVVERICKDFEMVGVRWCGAECERVKEKQRRKMVIWEFRNLSAISISMFAIYIQIAACMRDRKAMSRAFFFFLQSHITLPSSSHTKL